MIKYIYKKIKNYYQKFNRKSEHFKKIKNLNLNLKVNEKKIVCLSDLLNKSPNDGVIVECGVGVGFSLTVLALLSKKKYLLLTVFPVFQIKSLKMIHQKMTN